MSNITSMNDSCLPSHPLPGSDLAAAITKASSQQTYYTIRFLADRDRAADAYRSYAYFRWVDDILDAESGARPEKVACINRQQALLEACYRRETPAAACPEEQMLIDLVRDDREKDSGLQAYLRNMMAVMAFDVARRGQLISQAELAAYSLMLATAVTEALHTFIGHQPPSPGRQDRYLAVRGAHVIHMLRDMREDIQAGYFNIPQEYLQAHGLSPQDIDHPTYRSWVASRVALARRYFWAGRSYIAQVKNFRCRLAGYAYIARFEWMAQAIERDGYRLRAAYPERKSRRAGLWMLWRTLLSASGRYALKLESGDRMIRPVQVEER